MACLRIVPVMLAVLGLVSGMWATDLRAEMVIKLKNGKTMTVDVNENEIESISFKHGTAAKGPVLKIMGAQYGAAEFSSEYFGSSKRKKCNAKKALKKLCEGRKSCTFKVDNRLCGDPVPGKGKQLMVEYQCGKDFRRAKADEGTMMVLTCQ